MQRICNTCGNVVTYTTEISYKISLKNNPQKCRKCAALGTIKSKETRNKIANSKRMRFKIPKQKTDWFKNCPSCDNIVYYTNKGNLNRSIRENDICKACSNRKIMTTYLKTAEGIQFWKKQVYYGINLNACKIFDEINKEMGWNGQHAENGGEFHVPTTSYKVDYYEPTLNIVIEYDEKHHKYNDEIRQNKIIKILDCKFYRLNEGDDWRDVII